MFWYIFYVFWFKTHKLVLIFDIKLCEKWPFWDIFCFLYIFYEKHIKIIYFCFKRLVFYMFFFKFYVKMLIFTWKGSIFKEFPVKNAKTYIFMWILYRKKSQKLGKNPILRPIFWRRGGISLGNKKTKKRFLKKF